MDAVRAGAGLAAPVLETCGGDVYGYRAEADGSLWPLREGEGEPDALALDCLAAPREFWISGLPEFDAVEGHYELQVARAAGSLAVVPDAGCRRRTIGPPASVIVCTQDRPDEIVPCVEALLAAGADEVVVVDNGSGAPLGLPDGVKLVREPVAGLSRARNTGAEAATHDVLVYLDDDARPAPGWLEHLRDAFADDAVMVAGGPIHGLLAAGAHAGLAAGRRGRATSRSSRTATPTRRGRAATSTARTGPSAARRSTRSAASSTAGARPATACSPARRPRSSS